MVLEHDFKKFPELSNTQLNDLGFTSPHKQITEDFEAVVEKVHDGDTVRLSCDFRDFTFPLRLLDIDAPELNEDGGHEARDWLQGEIEGQEVWIRMDRDNRVGKYGRLLGRVIHLGMDVSDFMLSFGLVKRFDSRSEGEIPTFERVVISG